MQQPSRSLASPLGFFLIEHENNNSEHRRNAGPDANEHMRSNKPPSSLIVPIDSGSL